MCSFILDNILVLFYWWLYDILWVMLIFLTLSNLFILYMYSHYYVI